MRHKGILLVAILSAWLVPHGYGQKRQGVEGWDVVVLPSVSYNTDLGFHYGVYGNAFYYGQGERCSYPHFRHKLSFEASRYTSKQSLLYLQYDGCGLPGGIDISATGRWQTDPYYYFWGYNGLPFLSRQTNALPYYRHHRRYLMLNGQISKAVTPRLKVFSAITLWDYDIAASDSSDTEATNLWASYRRQGLIEALECDGGTLLDFKIGVHYDSRNHPTTPSQGCLAEAFLTGSIDLRHAHYNSWKANGQFVFYHAFGSRVVLANRTVGQYTLAGEEPYFTLTNIHTLSRTAISSEGLGGVTTLRGMPLNALSTNGFAWNNTEVRIRLFSLRLLKRDIDVVANPFYDIGIPLQFYRMERQTTGEGQPVQRSDLFRPYMTIGIGGKLIVNQNFVLSVEAGMLLNDPAEHRSWSVSFCTGYIF